MKESIHTPYKELDIVLENYTLKLKETLKHNLVGVYLQGSLAIGDFDMTSDVDFMVVINDELSDKEVKLIQKIHDDVYKQDYRWVKRLEYSFFPKEKLNEISSPFENGKENNSEDRKLWYFDNGSKKIEKSDHDNTLVVRWTVREKGFALFGPDPKEFINPVNPNDLRREIKETMLGWGKQLLKDASPYKNRFYQSYLVLNFSRMLHDLYMGKVSSKLEAMRWAKLNLDSKWLNLIDFCWEERQDTSISVKQPAKDEVFKRSLEFVAYTLEKAEKFIMCNNIVSRSI
ncbi:MAG: aminoglycoside adenylyltransferase domain-containing protein [Patescibacteria group bacterium]